MADPNIKIVAATEEDFENFVKKCKDSTGWNVVHKDAKCTVYDQATSGSINLVRLTSSFDDIPALVLYDCLHDPDYRGVWDDKMIEGFNIQQIDKFNDVGYYSAKAPMGVANRDWVNLRSWRIKDDKQYIIMNHSVVHPEKPEVKGFVRANSIYSGYYVEVKEGGGCDLTYVTQNDAKGWIPAWLTNKVTKTFAPSIVDKVHDACKKYEDWKKKQEPPKDKRPWR